MLAIPDRATNLMCDIRASFTDIPVHLTHDTNVLIAVEQGVLLITTGTIASAGSPVGFQAGMGENDNQTLGLLVMSRDGSVLFRNELGQFDVS